MSADIAVVGAGLAGLTAANDLVDAGHRVTLFERAESPGGRAASTMHGPYRFNRGPHALYRSGEAATVLADLGVTYTGHVPIQATPKALHRSRIHRLPAGPGALLRTSLLSPRSKLAVAMLLPRLARLAPGAVGLTVDEWVDARTDDPALAGLLHGLFRLTGYANAPDVTDAGAALEQLAAGVSSGVVYLDGGWQALADGLAGRATGAGARIERATVTDLGSVKDAFDGIVLAVGGPAITARTAGAVDRADALVAAAGPAVEAAVLELGVTQVPATRFILGIDEALYGSVHSPPTDLAPAGHAVVCLARYLRPGEQHDAEETRAELTDLAHRMGVAPGHIAAERYLHRMTVTNGVPLATGSGFAGRPDVDCLGDPQVMVAGDWVGPSGLLADASVASGRRAARALAANLSEATPSSGAASRRPQVVGEG
ncbi:MAG: FAD-dependent oxidoreductase [Actinomycetota bacterium]